MKQPTQTGPRYKADAALSAAKERETARLTRIHCERVLNTPKPAALEITGSMFDELPATDGQQTRLF